MSRREEIRKALADSGVAVADGEWKDRLIDRLERVTLTPNPRPDEVEHGHRWRIRVVSAGSYGATDPESGDVDGWKDAQFDDDLPIELELRAFDLPTALRLAAAVPLTSWKGFSEDGEDA